MKAVYRPKNRVEFATLSVGDIFAYGSVESICMKILSYVSKNDDCMTAVDLSTGELVSVSPVEQVTPLEYIFHVWEDEVIDEKKAYYDS